MKKAALLILVIFIISCAPPGIEDVPDEPIKTNTTVDDTPSLNETVETTTSGTEQDENTTEPAPKNEKEIKPQCISGERKCKDNALIECKSQKWIKVRDCDDLGCWDNSRCGSCVPNSVKCEGNDLVTCTADGRKRKENCYTCENEKCNTEPPEPEPFTCKDVYDVTSENAEVLQAYSPFKKDYVDQIMYIKNGPITKDAKLGYVNHKGQFIDETSGNTGNEPVYIELGKCYVNCIVAQPFEVTIQCKGSYEVKAYIPAFVGYANSPMQLLVGRDGSTYFLDSSHNGEGERLTAEEALSDTHLARKAR